MEQGIQSLQYINSESHLCKDFRIAFGEAMRNNDEKYEKLRDYLALQLMYLKPYSGVFKNRRTGQEEKNVLRMNANGDL